jgi:hypothetical protein
MPAMHRDIALTGTLHRPATRIKKAAGETAGRFWDKTGAREPV